MSVEAAPLMIHAEETALQPVEFRLSYDHLQQLNQCAWDDGSRLIGDQLRSALTEYFDADDETCVRYLLHADRNHDRSEQSMVAQLQETHIKAIGHLAAAYGTTFSTPIHAAIRYHLSQRLGPNH